MITEILLWEGEINLQEYYRGANYYLRNGVLIDHRREAVEMEFLMPAFTLGTHNKFSV